MPRGHKSLQGQLLLDGGKLQGSFFHRSVVLICQHDAEGAFGLILNRCSESTVGEALIANVSASVKDQTLYVGGPVQPGALSFLHSDVLLPGANVMANLSLGHSLEALVDLTEAAPNTQKLKLFAGYSGWQAGQLDQEMARNDWLVHPASLDLVFSAEPAQLWRLIIKQRGDKTSLLADAPDDLSWN